MWSLIGMEHGDERTCERVVSIRKCEARKTRASVTKQSYERVGVKWKYKRKTGRNMRREVEGRAKLYNKTYVVSETTTASCSSDTSSTDSRCCLAECAAVRTRNRY